jgi:PleD family two-component response regulator
LWTAWRTCFDPPSHFQGLGVQGLNVPARGTSPLDLELRSAASSVTVCQSHRKKGSTDDFSLQNGSVTNNQMHMTQATPNARADKILILDDDARIRDLLRRYLAQEGFEVILAEDSKALNRIMLRDAVDLIVLDLMMPGVLPMTARPSSC